MVSPHKPAILIIRVFFKPFTLICHIFLCTIILLAAILHWFLSTYIYEFHLINCKSILLLSFLLSYKLEAINADFSFDKIVNSIYILNLETICLTFIIEIF